MATLSVGTVLDALQVGHDLQAVDAGDMSEYEFYVRWEMLPGRVDWIRVDLEELTTLEPQEGEQDA